MPDIISSLQMAMDITKKLRDLNEKVKDADMKMLLADLQGEIADARLEVVSLKEQVAALSAKNAELDDADMLLLKMAWLTDVKPISDCPATHVWVDAPVRELE